MANEKNIAQVDFIVNCLRQGLQRKSILAKFGKKWQDTSERTFDRRLTEATAKFQAEQGYIQQRAEQEVAKEVEARKEAIMSAIERKEVLTKIARGEMRMKKHMVADGVIQHVDVDPDWTDRKNAIAELNKMDGAYASEKTEVKLIADPCVIDWTKPVDETQTDNADLSTNP